MYYINLYVKESSEKEKPRDTKTDKEINFRKVLEKS